MFHVTDCCCFKCWFYQWEVNCYCCILPPLFDDDEDKYREWESERDMKMDLQEKEQQEVAEKKDEEEEEKKIKE